MNKSINVIKDIAIIGASASSCLLALFLKKKKFGVTIFESSNNIGGAWGTDKNGAKYSNIIFPLSISEKKIFPKALKYLRTNKVKFKKDLRKSLFSKKVVNAASCDLNGLYNLTKKKIKIIKNTTINSVKEKENYVELNNKYKFSNIFFPTYIKLKKIKIHKNNKTTNILVPYLKINKALHVRLLVKNLSNKQSQFKNLTLGPLDRYQIINKKKNISQINGRVQLDWKKKPKYQILNNISQAVDYDKLLSAKFFEYRSCIRDKKQIQKLKKEIKKTQRIKYLETFTLLEFIRLSVFNKNFLKKVN